PGAQAYPAAHVGTVFAAAARPLVAAAAVYDYGAYVPQGVHPLRRTRLALLPAVAALVVAALAGLARGVVEPVARAGTIPLLHTVSWLCAGVVHTGTLGLYVAWLARSLFWSPGLRTCGAVAGWSGVAGVAVLAFGELSPFATAARVA